MVSSCEVLVVIITQHYSGFSDLLLAKFSDCPLNIKQKVRRSRYIATLNSTYR